MDKQAIKKRIKELNKQIKPQTDEIDKLENELNCIDAEEYLKTRQEKYLGKYFVIDDKISKKISFVFVKDIVLSGHSFHFSGFTTRVNAQKVCFFYNETSHDLTYDIEDAKKKAKEITKEEYQAKLNEAYELFLKIQEKL